MKLLGQNMHPAFIVLGITEIIGGVVAFLVASWIVFGLLLSGSFPGSGLLSTFAFAFGAAIFLGMMAMGLYHPKQRLAAESLLARQFVGLLIASTLLAILNFFFSFGIPGTVWMLSITLAIPVLAASRVGFNVIVDRDAFRRRVLVLGAGERASALLRLRRHSDQRGFRLVAFLPADGDKYRLDDERVRDKAEPLYEFAHAHRVNEIVVAMDDRRKNLPLAELLRCRFSGIEVMDMLGFLERETGRIAIDVVTPDWMIYSAGYTSNAIRDWLLRAMDLLLVVLTAVVTVPVMVLVAFLIFVREGRPILYRQARVGLGGEVFTLYKFRSMIPDAEADGKAQWASTNDSRITRVGAFIRKYRLDELPQLFNVLRGDMSLVGPRPERPEFVHELSEEVPYYAERHCVKPGLTGWAQMSYPYGSSEDDAKEKLAFDLYYVKHRSLIFNLVVLLQTAEVVLWKKGAR